MSIIKKIKESYIVGKDFAYREQNLLREAKESLMIVESREGHPWIGSSSLEDYFSSRIDCSRGLAGKGRVEHTFFYIGRRMPYLMNFVNHEMRERVSNYAFLIRDKELVRNMEKYVEIGMGLAMGIPAGLWTIASMKFKSPRKVNQNGSNRQVSD